MLFRLTNRHYENTLTPEANPAIPEMPPTSRRSRMGIYYGLLAIAIGAALLTLVTPRDFDDWFYLAYIRDYVAGKPLGAEDALFDMGIPAPPRIWFGAAWWVLEAIVSKASSLDPVACRQVYMPILTLPFAVLALFTLCKSVFRSISVGLLAVSLQVLFYLSSAFPQKSVGWFFFCRIAQDKAVSFFVIAPFVAALGLRMMQQRTDQGDGYPKNLYGLYWLAAVTSFLVHGMGPVWCGLLILPALLAEWLRNRDRIPVRKMAMLIMPILACWLVLAFARGLMGGFFQVPGPDPAPVSDAVSGLYLPGNNFGFLMETRSPVVWIFREGLTILNPLYVIRYPLAIAGVVLTFLLIPQLKSAFAARFIFSVTLTALFLTYTPIGAAAASSLMTSKLLFRLSWLFPWGLTVAFFLRRIRLRPLFLWLMVAAIGLGLARGNPKNYADPLSAIRSRNRPSAEAVDALQFLASEPSPQGAVFAPDAVSRMIAGYLPDATPVTFRDEGPLSRDETEEMATSWRKRWLFFKAVRGLSIRYVLLETGSPLGRNLARKGSAFTLRHSNDVYSLWRVEAGIDTIPIGDLVH
jgi:hypothetical protein